MGKLVPLGRRLLKIHLQRMYFGSGDFLLSYNKGTTRVDVVQIQSIRNASKHGENPKKEKCILYC